MQDIGPSPLYILTYFVHMSPRLVDTADILIFAWLADSSPNSSENENVLAKFSEILLPYDIKFFVIFIWLLMDG